LISLSRRQNRGSRNSSRSVELAPWCSLIGFHASSGDLGAEVVLATNGMTEHPPQEADLPDVGERVGDRALEYLSRLVR
jgi:hypothetical protein